MQGGQNAIIIMDLKISRLTSTQPRKELAPKRRKKLTILVSALQVRRTAQAVVLESVQTTTRFIVNFISIVNFIAIVILFPFRNRPQNLSFQPRTNFLVPLHAMLETGTSI
jgi:hypothetical protein